MSNNHIWQYAIVLIIITVAIVKIIYDVRHRKSCHSGCSGCSIADACKDKNHIRNSNAASHQKPKHE